MTCIYYAATGVAFTAPIQSASSSKLTVCLHIPPDNDTVRVHATQPMWRDLPGSTCTPSDHGSAENAGPCSPARLGSWAWADQSARHIASFSVRYVRMSCEELGLPHIAAEPERGVDCPVRLRWRCFSLRDANSEATDNIIEIVNSKLHAASDHDQPLRIGGFVRGDEFILMRCPPNENLSTPLTTEMDGATLERPGSLILARM